MEYLIEEVLEQDLDEYGYGKSPVIESPTTKYEVRRELGSGGFGIVFLANTQNPYNQYAMKIFKKENPKEWKRETCAYKVLSSIPECNPHITCLVEHFSIAKKNGQLVPIEVFELMEGDMSQKYADSDKDALNFVISIAKGLKFMHDSGFAHRDIKSENIMWEKDYTVRGNNIYKIGDVGLTCIKGEKCAVGGDPRYRPPEILHLPLDIQDETELSFEEYTVGDLWSFGMVLINFLGPSSERGKQYIRKIEHKVTMLYRANQKLSITQDEIDDYVNEIRFPQFKKIVRGLLSVAPKERISLERVLEICDTIYIKSSPAKGKSAKSVSEEDEDY